MPQFGPAGDCPICLCADFQLAGDDTGRDAYHLRCLNCGDHVLTGSAHALAKNDRPSQETRALLAYRIYRVGRDVTITTDHLMAMAVTGSLPEAAECLDNLLLYLAARQQPGEFVAVEQRRAVAALGVVSHRGVAWAIRESLAAGWIDSDRLMEDNNPTYQMRLRLTAKGWAHYRQLLRSGIGSRHAFMAMDFKEDDIRRIYADHLAPGVKRTGFDLRTTEHAQKTAGLIDSRMRVELHTSRFVVCDLTHNNRGAYWEAGFAEGIGRPVFYLCRNDVLSSSDPERRPHFDIAHQAIVKWDLADPVSAVEELVAMIRATLPGEARMED